MAIKKIIYEKYTGRNILLALLAFLGLGAIVGGSALIISPQGELLGGLPVSILDRSPFNNFLIPGVILFCILGVIPIMLIIALIERPVSQLAERINFFTEMHWAWTYTIYIAFALVIWIQAEMEFIHLVHWLHTFYIFLALLIIFIALLPQVRSLYKK